MDYAIKARYILSFQNSVPTIIENGTVLVEGTEITAVGTDIETSGKEVIYFDNHILMPGFVNTHTHAAMTLTRSLADDVPLDVWLNEHIWPLEAEMTERDVEVGARIAAMEALLSGTTTVNSMYWHPDAEAKAFVDIGLRSMIGPPIISGVNTLKTHAHLIPKWHGKNNGMTRVTLNPHAPYTVTDEEYRSIHEFKNEYNEKNQGNPPLKIHTHMAESPAEMKLISDYAKSNDFRLADNVITSVDYFDSIDLLDSDLIAAHVVECEDRDISLLAEKKVGISINPVSNMKLGNNTAKIAQMIEKETVLGLGTDGPASNNSLDMFDTMKITSLLQKSKNNDPSKGSAIDTLRMATSGGAAVLGWDELGKIEPQKKADLILLDLNKTHLKPLFSNCSLLSHLVYSAKGSDVSDVMVNGEWRVRNGEVLGVDMNKEIDIFTDTVTKLGEKI